MAMCVYIYYDISLYQRIPKFKKTNLWSMGKYHEELVVFFFPSGEETPRGDTHI